VDLAYQLDVRQRTLCRMCVTWQRNVRGIPCEWRMPNSWGPSEERLRDAARYEVIASLEDGDDLQEWGRRHGNLHNDSEDSMDDESGRDDDGEELVEAVEAAALLDAYREGEGNDGIWVSDDGASVVSRTASPRKRARRSSLYV
jgi:hypothetical protein